MPLARIARESRDLSCAPEPEQAHGDRLVALAPRQEAGVSSRLAACCASAAHAQHAPALAQQQGGDVALSVDEVAYLEGQVIPRGQGRPGGSRCAGRGRPVVVQPVSDVNGASDRPSASDDAPGPPASALDRGRLGSKE